MATQRVVVIPGEDAGAEACEAALDVLGRFNLEIEWLRPPVGEAGVKECGTPFPEGAREAIDHSDATLFGATSGPSAPALFYLRWGKQTYANVRPARWFPGCKSPLAHPEDIDCVIVRENLEDMYVRVEGALKDLAPLNLRSPTVRAPLAEMGAGRYAVKAITHAGTERVARFACDLARRRKAAGGAGKLTCGTKHNMLPQSDGYFLSIVRDVVKSYADIEFESFIVDDLACRLAARPHEFDVIVLPNLYGDVLSDLAAGLIGGLGLAPSGCYGDAYAYFESAHGSAPDIAGRDIVNPTATLLSAALMLDYLGYADEARRLRMAIERMYAEGEYLTPDQGGDASTSRFCATLMGYLAA